MAIYRARRAGPEPINTGKKRETAGGGFTVNTEKKQSKTAFDDARKMDSLGLTIPRRRASPRGSLSIVVGINVGTDFLS